MIENNFIERVSKKMGKDPIWVYRKLGLQIPEKELEKINIKVNKTVNLFVIYFFFCAVILALQRWLFSGFFAGKIFEKITGLMLVIGIFAFLIYAFIVWIRNVDVGGD